MKAALKAYGAQRAISWTRIDMLLAIYDGAIDRIAKARTALESGRHEEVEEHRAAAQKLVIQLVAGIDLQYGETVERIHQLCVHVTTQLSTPTVESFAHCSEILSTLREGFQGIREEAIRMEADGEIPSIRMTGDVDLTIT